jgi:hypothetical protein
MAPPEGQGHGQPGRNSRDRDRKRVRVACHLTVHVHGPVYTLSLLASSPPTPYPAVHEHAHQDHDDDDPPNGEAPVIPRERSKTQRTTGSSPTHEEALFFIPSPAWLNAPSKAKAPGGRVRQRART